MRELSKKVKRLVALATLLTISMLPISDASDISKAQTIPDIEDPTPGYWETSEYMIGSVAVGIILPESNGIIDRNTEDWTDEEIEKVLSEIQIALDWWAEQNENASVSFIIETHLRVPTSYEPIDRTRGERFLWMSEVMSYLGYSRLPRQEPIHQIRDYINAARSNNNTDWAVCIFVVDSSNDEDGLFKGGGCAASAVGGPYLYMTLDNNRPVWGIENMDRVCAHEIGNIFMAADEYFEEPTYKGYLNVPSIPGSNCVMHQNNWCLSGAPHGHNGTWGQIGWRDIDHDGIPDIVDTIPTIYFNASGRIGNRINYTGLASVTPYPNKNPYTNNPNGRRNVSINVIEKVQFRVDDVEWQNATLIPHTVQKLARYPDTYVDKETYAIVNFTFLTPELEPGNYTIEVKAINQWGNSGYANTTVEVQEFLDTDLNKDGTVNIVDISIVAMVFGTQEGDENYNPIADLDGNKEINIVDVAIVALDYGKTV